MCEDYIFYVLIISSTLLIISEFLPFTSLKYHGILKNIFNCCKKSDKYEVERLLENNSGYIYEYTSDYNSDNEYSLFTDMESVKQKLNIIIDKIEDIQEKQEVEKQKIEIIETDNRWFFQRIFGNSV
jgi:hypothetical protein